MKKKGFTLIELLIVIVIIGILAVAFLPTALNAPKRARDAQRKAHLQAIVQAVEQYGLDKAPSYPATGCLNSSLDTNLNGYFRDSKPPIDPNVKGSISYPSVDCAGTATEGNYYYSFTSGNCYLVAARMEDTKSGNTKTGTPAAEPSALNCTTPASLDPTAGGQWFVIRNKI